MVTHFPRARRSLVRLAAALGLGLGLLAASAATTSANCGVIIDPITNTVIEIPCEVDLYTPVLPDPPCLCPYVDTVFDPRVLTIDQHGLAVDASAFTSPGDLVALNPQPLPPRAFGFGLR